MSERSVCSPHSRTWTQISVPHVYLFSFLCWGNRKEGTNWIISHDLFPKVSGFFPDINRNNSIFEIWNIFHKNAKNLVSCLHLATGKIYYSQLPQQSIAFLRHYLRVSCHLSHWYYLTLFWTGIFLSLSWAFLLGIVVWFLSLLSSSPLSFSHLCFTLTS